MNIVLIGMPGCGKSTVGVLLAKTFICDFCDTDIVIQKVYGKSLCALIEEYGVEGFKKIENKIISGLHLDNSVVATGGSAVYGMEAMERMKQNGTVIYLKLPPEVIKKRIKNITTRGIAMTKGTSIERLYAERAPLYEKYADITVDCKCLTAEECVEKIKEKLYENINKASRP